MSINITEQKHDIQKYYNIISKEPNDLSSIPLFREKFPFIHECDCFVLKNSYRRTLDAEIVLQVNEKIEDKNAPLVIASFGSDQCGGELCLLTKLLQEGYQNIQITLIDPKYAKSTKGIDQVKEFCEMVLQPQHPNAKIAIESLSDGVSYLEEVKNKKRTPPQIFLLIDLQSDNASPTQSVLDLCTSQIFAIKNELPVKTLFAFTNYKKASSGGLGEQITICGVLPKPFFLHPFFKKNLLAHTPEASFSNKKYGCAVVKLIGSKGQEKGFDYIFQDQLPKTSYCDYQNNNLKDNLK
jgi:hypothetical protein